MQVESALQEFIKVGKTIYDRGYATGSSGNMSMILPDGNYVATPSGSCLGALEKDRLSILDKDGNLISGDKATKEFAFHKAIYENNSSLKAVVHLHSNYCTALSCLDNLNKDSCLKPFTPYLVMRMGDIPVVPYYKPGSNMLAVELAKLAPNHNAFLLANHGPITCGKTLAEALNNAEEFEATARVFFTLASCKDHIRYLTDDEIAQLKQK